MKTIKIFLASSEEMDYDRMVFGNLIRRLDDVYEKRGVRLKLFEWEDYDAAFNDRRKQDEYNDKVKESDVFLALFHKKAGKFTIEEFDVASEAFKEKTSPKVYTYLRDLQPGEEESPELSDFKKRLFDEMGHYWCRYDNRDSLQLQFVMQLQLVESSLGDSVKVEEGEVNIDGMKVASMDRLQFAAGNEDYVKMSEELAALPAKIEKARLRLEKFPDDEDLIDDLQLKLNKYNKLKEDFAEYQKLLFNTAKRVAQLQSERVTERMRRAMDAFNEGKIREANIILDEAEADARRNLEDYKQSKEITELKRQAVISSIEELLLKTSTVMADDNMPIEERIEKTEAIYAQAVGVAEEIDYEEVKYAEMLSAYGVFLYTYHKYDKALEVRCKALKTRVNVFGEVHPDTATSYNSIGLVYSAQGDNKQALEYYRKALDIRMNLFGEMHCDTAESYHNIGCIYKKERNYPQAMEYYAKTMEIEEEILGRDQPYLGITYDNVGALYFAQEDYDKALHYHNQAIEIFTKAYGTDHQSVSIAYYNLGLVYERLGDFQKALDYYTKSLEIDKKLFGEISPDIASLLNKMGLLFKNQADYNKALDYYTKALNIRKKVLGESHSDTAISYCNIGIVYNHLGNYGEAIESFLKALIIKKNNLGEECSDVAYTTNWLGATYEKQGKLERAYEFRDKALSILETIYGTNHKDVVFIRGKIEDLKKRMAEDIQ